MTLGELEYLIEGDNGSSFTATSVEYSELIKLSRDDMIRFLKKHPDAEKQLWNSAVAKIKESGGSKRSVGQSEFIHMALYSGLVQGNSILVIDLNSCTRCDDCVRGCSSTH